MKQIDWIPEHRNSKLPWYQRRYRGPYWVIAVLWVAIWAAVVGVIDYLDQGPAARVSVEVIAEAPHSLQ